MSLLELFCDVDDFWKTFRPYWYKHLLNRGDIQRVRSSRLSPSEIMTLLILFHKSHYRNFKAFYTQYVMVHLDNEFPGLVSYNRFVELMPSVTTPLLFYFLQCKGNCSGIAFVDATSIKVCHNRRIGRHKVFAGLAHRGKTSMGWFYGFKLHLIVNDLGEILTFYLSPGNVDDRKPVSGMAKNLFGKLFGDKGYISQPLFEQLFAQDVQLITPIRKNMKNRLMDVTDKVLLRRRAVIETINDQLKNISQIEHTRHRSVHNFVVNMLYGLIADCQQAKKPSLNLTNHQVRMLSKL